jgi:hypothetical protein
MRETEPTETDARAQMEQDLIASAELWKQEGDRKPTLRAGTEGPTYREWCYARAARLRALISQLPE